MVFSIEKYYAEKGISHKPISELNCPYDGKALSIKLTKDKDGNLVGGNFYFPFAHTIWKCNECKAEFIEVLKQIGDT